jgi:CheY-like chemotaxis protein
MTETNVLIVEDDGIVAKDLQERLKELGYDVVAIAYSSEDALKKVYEKKPHLVLMDIRLRGEPDGIETARRLREKLRIPIIYITAYADDETVQRAMSTKPYGYLLKPFDQAELELSLKKATLIRQLELSVKMSGNKKEYADKVENYRKKVLEEHLKKIEHKKNQIIKDRVDSGMWRQEAELR